MKIIVANTMVPFENNDMKKFSDNLLEYLRKSGNQVEKLELPFSSDSEDLLSQLLALRLHHIEKECDRLICTDVYANLLRHDHKYSFIINSKLFLRKELQRKVSKELTSLDEYKIRSCLLGFRESEKIMVDSLLLKTLLKLNNIRNVEMFMSNCRFEADIEQQWNHLTRSLTQ